MANFAKKQEKNEKRVKHHLYLPKPVKHLLFLYENDPAYSRIFDYASFCHFDCCFEYLRVVELAIFLNRKQKTKITIFVTIIMRVEI